MFGCLHALSPWQCFAAMPHNLHKTSVMAHVQFFNYVAVDTTGTFSSFCGSNVHGTSATVCRFRARCVTHVTLLLICCMCAALCQSGSCRDHFREWSLGAAPASHGPTRHFCRDSEVHMHMYMCPSFFYFLSMPIVNINAAMATA